MRTTLDLPNELIQEAMEVAHAKTKTKVIVLALEELIRKSKVTDLKKFKGTMDLEIDLDVIRGR